MIFAGNGAANTGDARLIGGMLAVWLGQDQHADCAVLLCVHGFHSRGGVTGVAGSVEDERWTVLLRLVVEEEDNLALHINACVIVVMKFGRGDAEGGEDYVCGDIHIMRKGAKGFRELPFLLCAARLSETKLWVRSARYSISGTGCR